MRVRTQIPGDRTKKMLACGGSDRRLYAGCCPGVISIGALTPGSGLLHKPEIRNLEILTTPVTAPRRLARGAFLVGKQNAEIVQGRAPPRIRAPTRSCRAVNAKSAP